MGLDQVDAAQSEYRRLLREPPGAGGPTLAEQAILDASKTYGETTVVNMAVAVQASIPHGGDKQPVHCLREAIALLDDLDTLGMEVRFKDERTSPLR